MSFNFRRHDRSSNETIIIVIIDGHAGNAIVNSIVEAVVEIIIEVAKMVATGVHTIIIVSVKSCSNVEGRCSCLVTVQTYANPARRIRSVDTRSKSSMGGRVVVVVVVVVVAKRGVSDRTVV